MDKFTNVINDKYQEINGCSLNNKYKDIYLVVVDEENKNKLNYILAYYHQSINDHLSEVYRKRNVNNHYCADTSRDFIDLLSSIEELQECLRSSPYYFKISKQYYMILKRCKEFLSASGGSHIPDDLPFIKLINYESIFTFPNSTNDIPLNNEINKAIAIIKSGTNEFYKLNIDERLGLLNNLIEYLLKKDGKFITVDTDRLFKDLISNDTILKFRKITQCFRHASKDTIKEREAYSEDQKEFLSNLGMSICLALLKEYN